MIVGIARPMETKKACKGCVMSAIDRSDDIYGWCVCDKVGG